MHVAEYPIVVHAPIVGEYPMVRRTSAVDIEREIERETHALVVQEHGRWGGVPETRLAQWHYDLRKGKLRIYGALLRWIDEQCENGSTLDLILGVFPRFIAYARAKYDEVQRRRRGRVTATARMYITDETETVK